MNKDGTRTEAGWKIENKLRKGGIGHEARLEWEWNKDEKQGCERNGARTEHGWKNGVKMEIERNIGKIRTT